MIKTAEKRAKNVQDNNRQVNAATPPDSSPPQSTVTQLSTTVDLNCYQSIVEMLETACKKFAHKPAFSNLGFTISFRRLEKLTRQFAAYLQNYTDLKPGDRIAIQLPNVLQFPVCVLGAMRAGLIVVNTNPLYTVREMVHQFNDAGVTALVVLANFGDRVEQSLPDTAIKTLIVTELADLLPFPKNRLINATVKYVKKMVPKYRLPTAVMLNNALLQGRKHQLVRYVPENPDVTAVLQYTGGTTGVSKGAELTHRNLIANMLQIRGVWRNFREGKEIMMTPLPLYHIFSFTVNCMAMIESGNHSVLITNPRDLNAFINEMKNWPFTAFAGLNTLFLALSEQEAFASVDFSHLKITLAGGMALHKSVAEKWQAITNCQICEGFGMTETSPVVCVNPADAIQIGSVGLPVQDTLVRVVDEQGAVLGIDTPGELCVKGPQVMKGYWHRDDETAKVFDKEGWLKTGDIAVIQADGYIRIVDRLKDMILVSGFNVYPNEIEDELMTHPDIRECAAIGVEDEKSGEVVKVFVVASRSTLSQQDVIQYARQRLVAYKVPKFVEFRQELPKSNVGKILRKMLREPT